MPKESISTAKNTPFANNAHMVFIAIHISIVSVAIASSHLNFKRNYSMFGFVEHIHRVKYVSLSTRENLIMHQ